MKGHTLAFLISSLYVAIMIVVGSVVGDTFNDKIGNILFLKGGSISLKYIGIISMSGVVIFIVTCLVIKRFNKYKITIEGNLNEIKEKIRYLDSYDSLTKLPNRNLMERMFTSQVPQINRDGNPGAFLFIDIDHFSFINETKGHHAGDQLLIDMAEILSGLKEEGDIIGRITQDKFVMIITGEETIKDIDKRINKIIKATSIVWKFEEKEYMVSTTIGVSLYPKDGLDYILLLKSANLALECSKESSRTSYEYYNKNKKCLIIKDLAIVSDMKIALKEEQFQMHYQPIYNLQTGEIENVESLLRWHHPKKGYISPDAFIPAAERAWIIDDIGEYTLEEVFRQKKEWNKQGFKLDRISINISSISLGKPGFGQYIEEKLQRYGLDGSEIVLELTESGFSTHKTRIKINVEYLRNLGVRISMDDFGTGYSSLARLRELQIDDIKLDRSFVVSLLEENGQEIIETLISLANALGKDIVSEGIETEEQCNILRDLGSKYGQGYFLARPMPAVDLAKYLTNKS